MAAESNLRKQEYLKKGVIRFESKRPASTPLGFWTEQDILQYLVENNLPIVRFMAKLSKTKMGNIIQLANIELAVCFVCLDVI